MPTRNPTRVAAAAAEMANQVAILRQIELRLAEAEEERQKLLDAIVANSRISGATTVLLPEGGKGTLIQASASEVINETVLLGLLSAAKRKRVTKVVIDRPKLKALRTVGDITDDEIRPALSVGTTPSPYVRWS